MAAQAIVFACANPIPEIWPWEAKEAGVKIIATGRSDFPNQVNNSLVFPGLSPGALDIRARTITDDMAIAVAHELADYARERGIHENSILPTMDEWEVYPRMAVATALQAQKIPLVFKPVCTLRSGNIVLRRCLFLNLIVFKYLLTGLLERVEMNRF